MDDRAMPSGIGGDGKALARLREDFRMHQGEPHDPSVCPSCGAVYREGRWQWLARPDHPELAVCAACRRTAEMLPAGYVYIDGAFADDHLVDILELVRREEASVRAAHPMQRIMSIDEHGGTTIVMTTGEHLARAIGAALNAAWDGALRIQNGSGAHLVRVYWRR